MADKRPNHRPPKERILDAAALTKDYYTAKEVSEFMNLCAETVRLMIRLGELPAKKIGKKMDNLKRGS